MTKSDPHITQIEVGTVAVEAGQVVLDGPDGIAVTLTPDVAAAMGQQMKDAAAEALRQDGEAPRAED